MYRTTVQLSNKVWNDVAQSKIMLSDSLGLVALLRQLGLQQGWDEGPLVRAEETRLAPALAEVASSKLLPGMGVRVVVLVHEANVHDAWVSKAGNMSIPSASRAPEKFQKEDMAAT